MIEVILGLGSNLGRSRETLTQALNQIENLNEVFALKRSPFFQTAPISSIEQNDFLNLVCLFQTPCEDPFFLLAQLQEIERRLGKVPKPKDAPRKVDIDILLYGKSYIQSESLILPHPRMLERLFVLEPLYCLKEEILFPESKTHFQNLKLNSLLAGLRDRGNQFVKKIE